MKLMGILAAGVSAVLLTAGVASAATIVISTTATETLTPAESAGALVTFSEKAVGTGAHAGQIDWNYSVQDPISLSKSTGTFWFNPSSDYVEINVPFKALTKLEIVDNLAEKASGASTASGAFGVSNAAVGTFDLATSSYIAGSVTPFGVDSSDFNLAAGNYILATFVTLATPVHGSGSENVSISESAQAVPEPAAWSLMLMGVGGIGAMMRRRRVAVAA